MRPPGSFRRSLPVESFLFPPTDLPARERDGTMLETILAHKRLEIEAARTRVPISMLEMQAKDAGPRRSMRAALAGGAGPPHRVIAEIKRASPSRGPLREDLDAGMLAEAYVRAGAAGLSVLTDERFFRGSLEDLERVRARIPAPLLRKDFLLDPYQLLEALVHGADAVLLIARALADDALQTLMLRARDLDLEVMVEVHDERDLDRALAQGAGMVGINNRDLATFRVDLSVTERLMRSMPPSVLAVSASGIRGRQDIDRLEALGVRAFLVGEALVTSAHPEEKLRELVW